MTDTSASPSFVLLSSTIWADDGQLQNKLANLLAQRGYQVTYVENLPKRLPSIWDIRRVLLRLSHVVLPPQVEADMSLTIVSGISLPSINRLFNWINGWIFIPWIVRRIHEGAGTDVILVIFLSSPSAMQVMRQCQSLHQVYMPVDRVVADFNSHQTVVEAHHHLLGQVDIIITPSPILAEEIEAEIDTPVLMLNHGVDFPYFNQLYRGQPITAIKKVGYFGTIDERLDFDFLAVIAERFEVLLIGPLRCALPPSLANIEYIPFVPQKHLLPHLADCDAFVLPYRINHYTLGINPLKALEALATGRVVVGTSLPTIQQYDGAIYIASDGKDACHYLQRIGDYESEARQQQRMDIARSRSWSHYADAFIQLVSD